MDSRHEACAARCSIAALATGCTWCECRACDFCVRYVADAHAAWRTLPLEVATTEIGLRTLSPTAIELASFRCPAPAGCRFRFRPLNVHGWEQWSLGSDTVYTERLPPLPADALRLEVSKEGRKEGRKEGSKEGRKEGSKEVK